MSMSVFTSRFPTPFKESWKKLGCAQEVNGDETVIPGSHIKRECDFRMAVIYWEAKRRNLRIGFLTCPNPCPAHPHLYLLELGQVHGKTAHAPLPSQIGVPWLLILQVSI